jgi:hypothetical protein
MSTVLLDFSALAEEGEACSAGYKLPLSKEIQEQVVLTKYESTNKLVSDVIHIPNMPWEFEVVADVSNNSARPRFTIDGRPLTFDDSYIIGMKGTCDGVVWMANDRILNEDELAMYEQNNPNAELPQFSRWRFRVDYIIRTQGRELRENLLQTAEQQQAKMRDQIRLNGVEDMNEHMGNFVKAMADRMGEMAHIGNPEAAAKGVITDLASLSSDELRAELQRRVKPPAKSPAKATKAPKKEE